MLMVKILRLNVNDEDTKVKINNLDKKSEC